MTRKTDRARALGVAGLTLIGGLLARGAQAVPPDPRLAFATYLGGSGFDLPEALTVDAAGNVYVTGHTASVDFPTVGGLEPPIHAFETHWPHDIFVTKFAPDGSVVYSTYLTNPLQHDVNEIPQDIAVDAAGNVYVAGFAEVSDVVVLVAKLSADGDELLYFDYHLGADFEQADAIAVDAQGFAYVTGATSYDYGTGLFRPSRDAFVLKLDPQGDEVSFRLFGGSATEDTDEIAVDAAGNVYLTGMTDSADFPTVNAFQASLGGWFDGFLAKLDPAGAIVYSTYLGGNDLEIPTALAVAADGTAAVAGQTASADLPTANAVQSNLRGERDIFVTRFGPGGEPIFSTYLGGPGSDILPDLALAPAGGLHLAGYGDPGPSQPGCGQGFMARLDAAGSAVTSSTCFTAVGHIKVDSAGNAYFLHSVVGGGLPIVNAFQPAPAGDVDAYVAKVVLGQAPDCSAASASPALLWPPNGKLVPVSITGVTDPDGDLVTIRITGIRQDEPLAGGPAASGVGTSTARVKAERAGGGDGRVYHVAFEVTDPQGAACTGTAIVCVPHDRRPGAGCRDGGVLFDSTGR